MSFLREALLEVPAGGRDDDLRAETNVLGNLIADPRLLDEPEIQALSPECFYRARHAALFGWLQQRGPDAESFSVSEAKAFLEETGVEAPLSWVLEIVDLCFTDWRWASRRVLALSTARRVQGAAMELWRRAGSPRHDETADSIAEAAGAILGQLSASQVQAVDTVPEIGSGFLQDLERQLAGETSPALSTGFAVLDDLLGGGLHVGDFSVIGARPSCGKTSLARGIATALARAGHGVLFCSLEVSRRQVYRDLITAHSGIPAQVLRSNRLSETQRALALEAWEEIQGSLAPFRVTDRHKSLDRILACSRSHARLHRVRVVILDYLQLVRVTDGPRGQSRREQVGEVSRACKQLALDHEVHVCALAQLNRDVDKQADREPRMADLKESGDIEQDADLVMLLHRPDKQRERQGKTKAAQPRYGEAELILAKQRSGPTGRVALQFHGPSMTFSEPLEVPEEAERRYP